MPANRSFSFRSSLNRFGYRGARARRQIGTVLPLVLFDGYCHLCDGAVRFIIAHDRAAQLRFASLQSEAGRGQLARFGRDPDRVASVVLIDKNGFYEKSDAALRIAGMLDRPWSAAQVLLAVPRGVRNRLYDAVAATRYSIFGKRESCRVPSPGERARFVDA